MEPNKRKERQYNGKEYFPRWAPIVGVGFATLTVLFFMALVGASIFDHTVPEDSRFLVVIVLAFGIALSSAFLGGSAAARGHLPIPFLNSKPIEFSVFGGIAVFFIALLLGSNLYSGNISNSSNKNPSDNVPLDTSNERSTISRDSAAKEKKEVPEETHTVEDLSQLQVDELFRIIEDADASSKRRLQAFLILRDEYGWRDFRGRNLSDLDFPTSGWKGVEFTEANLKNTSFRDANLSGVNLIRANLSNADLRSAVFRDGKLNGAVLTYASCQNAVFDDAMLRGGKFDYTNFTGSRLQDAWLQAASFVSSNFSNADLRGSSFNDDDPKDEYTWARSNLSDAIFDRAMVQMVDFRNTVGLPTARFANTHYDVNTKFPENFSLNGRGLILR